MPDAEEMCWQQECFLIHLKLHYCFLRLPFGNPAPEVKGHCSLQCVLVTGGGQTQEDREVGRHPGPPRGSVENQGGLLLTGSTGRPRDQRETIPGHPRPLPGAQQGRCGLLSRVRCLSLGTVVTAQGSPEWPDPEAALVGEGSACCSDPSGIVKSKGHRACHAAGRAPGGPPGLPGASVQPAGLSDVTGRQTRPEPGGLGRSWHREVACTPKPSREE